MRRLPSSPRPSRSNRKKPAKLDPLAERPNLDWSKAVRGRYADRMKDGSNIVLLEPDVQAKFPTSEKVNRALRTLLEIERQTKAFVSAGGKTKKATAA